MSGISERAVRRIGRPSTAEPYRELVREILEQDPRLMSLELLRRVGRLRPGSNCALRACRASSPSTTSARSL
jgi:hypothetical protein